MHSLVFLLQAIGARNQLKSIAKQRESQKQQLQALIAEKKMQLERHACSRTMAKRERNGQNEGEECISKEREGG